MRRAAAWLLAAAAALAPAACGRMAPPRAPEDAFYPQQYPAVITPTSPSSSAPVGEEAYQQLKRREQLERERGAPQLLPPPAQPPAATTPGSATP